MGRAYGQPGSRPWREHWRRKYLLNLHLYSGRQKPPLRADFTQEVKDCWKKPGNTLSPAAFCWLLGGPTKVWPPGLQLWGCPDPAPTPRQTDSGGDGIRPQPLPPPVPSSVPSQVRFPRAPPPPISLLHPDLCLHLPRKQPERFSITSVYVHSILIILS